MLVAIKISYKEIDGSGLDSRLLSMYQIHTHISSAFSPKSAFRFDAHVWNCPLALMERLLADSIGCCASPAAGSRDARASFSVVQTATWFLSTFHKHELHVQWWHWAAVLGYLYVQPHQASRTYSLLCTALPVCISQNEHAFSQRSLYGHPCTWIVMNNPLHSFCFQFQQCCMVS